MELFFTESAERMSIGATLSRDIFQQKPAAGTAGIPDM